MTMKRKNKKMMMYCGNKKPTLFRPLVFSESVSIAWKTDKTKTKRGFDCRIKCSERLKTSSTTPSTATHEPHAQ